MMLIHNTLELLTVFGFDFVLFYFWTDKMHFTPFKFEIVSFSKKKKFEIVSKLISQLLKLTIHAIEYHNNVNASLLFGHIFTFNPPKTMSFIKNRKMKIIFKKSK